MKFKVEHQFKIAPSQLWSILSSEEFRQQVNEKNRITSRIVSESTEGEIKIVQSEIKYIDPLPKIEAKLLGSQHLSYILEQRITDNQLLSQWRILIPKLGKKIKAQGQFQLLAKNSNTQRSIHGEITVSVPLVGRKIEKNIVKKLEQSYNSSADLEALSSVNFEENLISR